RRLHSCRRFCCPLPAIALTTAASMTLILSTPVTGTAILRIVNHGAAKGWTLMPAMPSLLVLPVSIHKPISAQTDTTPVFEPAPCPVDFPADVDVECGMVIVPQDGAHPDERTLRLAVAVFKARRSN